MNYQRNQKAGTGLVVATLFFASALLAPSQATADEKESPPATYDNMVLVPDRKVAAAYVDPEADFSGYNKIMILDCYVAFKKNWKRDHKKAGSRISVSAADMEKIKADVAGLFRDVFSEKLAEDGGYEIVYSAGPDVLLVRPAIIDLDINAPDTMQAGRSHTFTSSAGAATLYVELYDSVTGDILARAVDRTSAQSTGGYLSYTNRVTNRADGRRILGRWAGHLRDRLDEFHGK